MILAKIKRIELSMIRVHGIHVLKSRADLVIFLAFLNLGNRGNNFFASWEKL